MANPLRKHIEYHSQIVEVLEMIEENPALDAVLREIYSTPVPATPPAPPAWVPPKSENGRGALKKQVLETLLATGTPMSTDMIADVMQRGGFQFKTDTPTISINEALNTWREDGHTEIDHTEGRKQFWKAKPVQENVQ